MMMVNGSNGHKPSTGSGSGAPNRIPGMGDAPDPASGTPRAQR
jgi:hypothetical protein